MSSSKLNLIQKILLFVGSGLLLLSLFVPLWRIDLDAPQYPEGLQLLIYPNKVGGQVEIVNGLNHYIGMKTIHNEDFIEFTVLPYIICGFALLLFMTAIMGKRKFVLFTLIAFVLFGILAMYDFWKWEYDYGHNLDPNAAIIVPGMAYQPPLIGFKQLLNFGAYSIPSTGGWLFIATGFLLLIVYFYPNKNKVVNATNALVMGGILFLSSCSNNKSSFPINFNEDLCDNCKMTIVDKRFACELITKKGRQYKFDDLVCLENYVHQKGRDAISTMYVCNFIPPHQLINLDSVTLASSTSIVTPMNGNIIAFLSSQHAEEFFDSTAFQYKKLFK